MRVVFFVVLWMGVYHPTPRPGKSILYDGLSMFPNPLPPPKMVVLLRTSFKNELHVLNKINFELLVVHPTIHSRFRTVLRGSRSSSSGLQDGFRNLHKRLKTLPSTYWTSLLCVWVAYCFQMFPKSIFKQCIQQNHHFCVFKDWFRLVFWSPIGPPGPPKSASEPSRTLQDAFKHPQDITHVCMLQ